MASIILAILAGIALWRIGLRYPAFDRITDKIAAVCVVLIVLGWIMDKAWMILRWEGVVR